MSAQAARLPNLLETAAKNGVEFVVIDTPPRVEAASLAAKAADAILIPCLPAINDLETVPTTMELLKYAGQPKAVVVLNSIPPRGDRRDQAEDAVRDMDIAVAPAGLGHRMAFPDAAARGRSVQETEPQGKAAGEVEELHKFVCELVNMIDREQGGKKNGKQAQLAASA